MPSYSAIDSRPFERTYFLVFRNSLKVILLTVGIVSCVSCCSCASSNEVTERLNDESGRSCYVPVTLLGKLLVVASLTFGNKWSINYYSVKSNELRTGCQRAASRLLFLRAWVSIGKPERSEPHGIADAEALLHRTRLFKMIIITTKMFAPPNLGRRVTYVLALQIFGEVWDLNWVQVA